MLLDGRRRRLLLSSLAMVALFALGLLVSRVAFAGNGDVIRRAVCSDGSRVKLKLSREDRGIEVELEVDQNRSGVPWRVRITRGGGAVVFSGVRRTRGPSGSFEIRRVVPFRAGANTFRARATRASGEVCRVSASFAGGGTGATGGTSTDGPTGTSTDDTGTTGGTSTGDDHGGNGDGSDD